LERIKLMKMGLILLRFLAAQGEKAIINMKF
jgi:hypothetical protein